MPPLRGSVGLALVLHSFSDGGSEAALHGCRPYPRKSAFIRGSFVSSYSHPLVSIRGSPSRRWAFA